MTNRQTTTKLPKFVPFGAPRFSRQQERDIVATMRTGWIGAGPKTLAFEHHFAAYVGSPEAVAVSSCTAALHLSLLAADIGPGDEVITTPLTFIATANAILMTGAKVRFADIDLDTYNLSPEKTQQAINKQTAAVIPVHFGGLPANLQRFGVLANKYHLTIIEDAAHAVGARYHGRHIGNSGNLVCFSFYPNKNMTSCEGGMITLRNKKLSTRLRSLRMHGLDADAWKRYHRKSLHPSLAVFVGYKYNLTDLQSTLGLSELAEVETRQRRREKYAAIYDSYFSNIPSVGLQFRPQDISENRHALHLYTLRLDRALFRSGTRDRVVQALLRKNIGASVHYYPAHLHPIFRSLGFRPGDFPVAEKVGQEIFTIPLTPHMSIATIHAIGRITRSVVLAHQRTI